VARMMAKHTSLLKIDPHCAHLTLYRRVTSEEGRMGLHEGIHTLKPTLNIKASVPKYLENSSNITSQLYDNHSTA
jgi:hypothetical protein